MNHPAVNAPIIGSRTMEQLTGALKATKTRFKKDELRQIDEIWPGPGGEAPEAYAWQLAVSVQQSAGSSQIND